MTAFPWLTVQENMAVGHISKYSRKKGLTIDWEAVRSDLDRSLKRLGFRFPLSSRP